MLCCSTYLTGILETSLYFFSSCNAPPRVLLLSFVSPPVEGCRRALTA